MKHIIHKFSSRIPDKISGAERQQYIGNLVQNMPPGELGGLREEMHRLLTAMAEKNASDIDMGGVGCRGKVWYRVHGDKRPDDTAGTFTEDECDVLFHCLLMESQREYLLKKRNLDFSYMINWRGRTYRYRADLYFDLDHLALNMRYINNQIRNFKTLELHPKVVMALTLIYEKRGLTLVTGITGSGKSSTLDSIIDANNQTANAHITIIGAPIETIHKSKKSIVRHREVGRDVMSFTEGAVQALRQDPDIIVMAKCAIPRRSIPPWNWPTAATRCFRPCTPRRQWKASTASSPKRRRWSKPGCGSVWPTCSNALSRKS